MAGLSAWIWLAIAVAFLAAEALAPGAVLVWLGVAAVLVAALEFSAAGLLLAPTLTTQVAVFGGAAILLLLAGRPLLLRWYGRRQSGEMEEGDPNDTITPLIGRTGEVIEAVTGGRGRVRVSGGEWPAAASLDMVVGTRVTVVAVSGTTLMIEPSPIAAGAQGTAAAAP